MAKLILLRHLKSKWNEENKFSGWTDVSLVNGSEAQALTRAEKLRSEKIDEVYTSPLKRNKETTDLILKNLGLKDLPVKIEAVFDERSYGLLEGRNKAEVAKEFGEATTQAWRRSWDVAPPEGESLKDVFGRVIPFFQNSIEPDLQAGKNVLIVASHNNLRAIAKYVEDITDDDIAQFEIPFGGIIVYDLDENLKVKSKADLQS